MQKINGTISFTDSDGSIITDKVVGAQLDDNLLVSFSEDAGLSIDEINEAGEITEQLAHLDIYGGTLSEEHLTLDALERMSALDLLRLMAAAAKAAH